MKKRYLLPALALPMVLSAPLVASASPASLSGSGSERGSSLSAAAEPRATLARLLDRGSADCTASSRMVSTLERDGQRLEVDAEIFGPSRMEWVVRFVQNGEVAHRIARAADGDGELDVWRYLPDRRGEDRVRVNARSAQDETCVIRLRG